MWFVTSKKQDVLFCQFLRQFTAERFHNIDDGNLRGNIVNARNTRLGDMPGEIKVRQFCETRVLVAGNGEHLTVVQAELAGEAQDLFGLTWDGKDNGKCIFRHIIGHREIRVVDMFAYFSNILEEACTIFRQRSICTSADKYISLWI